MLKYRFKQDNGSNYSDWEEMKIANVAKKNKTSVNPYDTPNTMFYEYSMPAFDEGKIPQYVEGNSMNSSRFVIQEDVILYNKLNVRKKRIWSVHNPNLNSVCSSEFIPVYPNGINQDFLAQLFSTDKFTNLMKSMSKGTSNSQKRINPDKFWETNIIVPCPEEQQKIADFLSAVDNQIDIQRQRVEVIETQKKGLLDKVFSQELRFKQDDGSNYPDWEEKQLKDVSDCSTARKTDKLSSYVSTDNMIANFGGVIFDNDDEGTIRSVEYRNNDILLSNIRPYFKKLWLSDRNGVCSSDVKVFRPNNVNPAFLYYALSLDKFFSYIMKNVTGTKMPRGNVDFMKKYKFMVSISLEEQQKIADFFTAIDNQIDIEKQRLTTMETIKKGLLQQMFC